MNQRPPRTLNVVLSHQRPPQVDAMAAWWARYVAADCLLLALSGPEAREEKDACAPASVPAAAAAQPQKIRLHDARLGTRDHQRERQSYAALFAAAARWMREQEAGGADAAGCPPPCFTHVHVAEYDHLPLVRDLNARQFNALAAEGADLLGHGLARVDGTNQPHYLCHAHAPAFHRFFAARTRRRDARTVLSMLGTGSFWTRAAFDAVAAVPEPFPIYLELWQPTLAHHLGFRVRPFRVPEAGAYVRTQGDLRARIRAARAAGAWSIHPVKTLWAKPAARIVAH